MALEPELKIEVSACSTFSILEVSGIYNTPNNLIGWGSPNLERTDDFSATLKVTYRNSADVETVLMDTEDVTSFINSAVTWSISLASLDLPGDGILKAEFKISAGDVSYTAETEQAVFCNAKCCIQKMAAEVAKELCNGCSTKIRQKFTMAKELYNALSNIAVCNGDQEFLKLLNTVEKLCNSSGCGCGCS